MFEIIRGVYSSIIRLKRWGIIFPLWGRIPSFGGKKEERKENLKEIVKKNESLKN